jgi:alcohol dehydrogenase
MKAYVIEKYGKLPLKYADMPVPAVGDHDLLVEVRAASINPIDFKLRDGNVKVLLTYDMPLIMGNDLAGVVTKVGAKVTRFKVGDEVYAKPPKDRIGAFAEFIAIAEDAVSLKPKRLSFEEAAAVPLVGLTSYQAIHDILQLRSCVKSLKGVGRVKLKCEQTTIPDRLKG